MSREAVILLHGLGRTKYSMLKLAFSLRKKYQVVNLGYPSRSYSIETLATMAIAPALERCEGASKVHFVTHSMGGILVRQYLSQNTISNLGHTVMLGPPNSGSEIVDFFSKQATLGAAFARINGPAGVQLSTAEDAKPKQLGGVDYSVGIIAGTVNHNPVWARIMPDEHDGKVSVASSKLQGMADHLILKVDHTFMMQNALVIEQIKYFLEQGEFNLEAVP